MEKPYTVFAALSDQANEGWIWFCNPLLHTRTIVKVCHSKTGRVVFCESRKIDPNFLVQYRQSAREIMNPDEALVISEWYRDALGGFATTSSGGDKVKLDITPAQIPGWRSLRASCHHPDIAVRVGTRLGVLGAPWACRSGPCAAGASQPQYWLSRLLRGRGCGRRSYRRQPCLSRSEAPNIRSGKCHCHLDREEIVMDGKCLGQKGGC
jgi:hypothetical protein